MRSRAATSAFVVAWAAAAASLASCRRANPAFEVAPGNADGGRKADRSSAAAGDAPISAPPVATGDSGVATVDSSATGSDGAAWLDAPGPRPPTPDGPELPPADLTTGLIAYFKLDEAPGSTKVNDSSGNSNHGTLEVRDPAQAWVPSGRPGGGGALQFPLGTRMPGVRVPDSPSFDTISRGLTVAGWAYRTAHGAVMLTTVISRQLNDGPIDIFDLAFRTDVPVAFFPGVGIFGSTSVVAPQATALSVWVHTAVTYDGATLRLYVNGKEAARTAFTQALPQSNNPIYIGNNRNGAGGMDEPFVGRVDEIVLYNRALPPDAIAALAAGASPRP